jgi:hypothetical protein
MKIPVISFLIFIILSLALIGSAQEEKEILWNGKTYSGRVNMHLKDGRKIEGYIRGGIEDQSVRIIPKRGGVEVTFPFSQIGSLELLPYDKFLEDKADGMVGEIESALDTIKCDDAPNIIKILDDAIGIYKEANWSARDPEDKNRINSKIRRTEDIQERLKNKKNEVKIEEKQEEHWGCVLEARDRLDYPLYFSLLLSHLDMYTQDQRAHNQVSDKIIKYENLPLSEKTSSLVFIGKYLQICSRHKYTPDRSTWKIMPVLFKDFLESLKKPGGYEFLESYYYGTTSIISLINEKEDLRADLAPWSGQVLSIDPKEYLYNSAVNEVRQGQVNAGDKLKLLLSLFPTRETYELMAELALYNHNLAEALLAYQEVVKKEPGGDPKTERLVNILNFLQETLALVNQGELEKARDNLMRVWEKKDDLPAPFVKMIYNMVAQCDLLILDQRMNQRKDKSPFYDFILERLAYFSSSYFSRDFFSRFKDVLCLMPVRYEFKIRSQDTEILPNSLITDKIKTMVGQKETYDSKIVVILEMSLDVEKDLDTRKRTFQVKHKRDSDDNTTYYKDVDVLDCYVITKRNIDGRVEIKTSGYGILYNQAFRKNHQERKLMTTVEGDDTGNVSIPDTQTAHWLARESSNDALYTSTNFIVKSLDESGMKPLSDLLQSIQFDPARKIELPDKKDNPPSH